MAFRKLILIPDLHEFTYSLLLVPLAFLSLLPLCSAFCFMILYFSSVRLFDIHLLDSFVLILYFDQQSVHVQAEVEQELQHLFALVYWQVSSSEVFQPNYLELNYGFLNLSNLNLIVLVRPFRFVLSIIIRYWCWNYRGCWDRKVDLPTYLIHFLRSDLAKRDLRYHHRLALLAVLCLNSTFFQISHQLHHLTKLYRCFVHLEILEY